MERKNPFSEDLIAPCGINCRTCHGYIRSKNRCNGCRHIDPETGKARVNCKIKNCEHLRETESRLCSSCPVFPCTRMKHIDKRYSTKYHTSLINNLEIIRKEGMEVFLAGEVKRWTCPSCGALTCVHRENCLKCGKSLYN
jgi:hypothetical protein